MEFLRLRNLVNSGLPNEQLLKLLSTFRCSKEPDVEVFLHTKAVDFEKRHLSRTYLWLDETFSKVAAYFSISLKTLVIDVKNCSLSRSRLKEIFYGFSPTKEEIDRGIPKYLPVYLIGQLGRHEEVSPDKLPGDYILDTAKAKIKECFESVGCKLVMVEVLDGDSETKQKLVNFYIRNGFQRLDAVIEKDKTLTRFYYVID